MKRVAILAALWAIAMIAGMTDARAHNGSHHQSSQESSIFVLPTMVITPQETPFMPTVVPKNESSMPVVSPQTVNDNNILFL